MTDIRPDMIGDVPRCSEECQYYDVERRPCGPDWYDEEGICRHESAMREPGDVCLPAVRELVVLSRLTQEQRNAALAEFGVTRLALDHLTQGRRLEMTVDAVAVALQSAYETGEHDGAHARRQLSGAHTAESWNAAHPVGTAVRYWPVYPPMEGIPPVDTTTRTTAWTLGDGSVVVSIVGRTGGVHLSHIELITGQDRGRACRIEEGR